MAELLSDLLGDWEDELRSSRKSAGTITAYRLVVRSFIRFAGDDLGQLTRREVRHWLGGMAELSPSTQQMRFTVLKIFGNWLVQEQIIAANPMEGMKRPAATPAPVEPFDPAEIAALLATCEGWSFVNVRDAAIIRMFVSTGMRRSELAGITLEKIDFEQGVIAIIGKGRGGGKPRVVPYDDATRAALRRYMRKRRAHKMASSPYLWLGERGAISGHSVGEMLKRRAERAKIGGVHAHRFRHTFADQWLADGGGELALQTLAGWSNAGMIKRYTAARAQTNALAEYRRRRG